MTTPKIAFIFTGQGSQYTNMAKQLYDTEVEFKETLNRCEKILQNHLDIPLTELLFNPTNAQKLNNTRYTQPALFAIEYSLFQTLNHWGIHPNCVLGHSVGEYVAATVAGVMSLEDGLMLIATRAKLMDSLPAGEGGMLAVLAPVDDVKKLAETFKQQHNAAVDIAAINSPKQIVFSGDNNVIKGLTDLFKANNMMAQPLTVSHAFHSSLMNPILAEFKTAAAKVEYHQPTITLISNVTGEKTNHIDAEYWTNHIRQAVNFCAGIQAASREGCTVFIEIGAHAALLASGMQSVSTSGSCLWVPTLHRAQENWQTLLTTISKLHDAGVTINWTSLKDSYQRSGSQFKLPNLAL